MGRDEMERPRNFANPVYETMFQVQHNFSLYCIDLQEREAPIIKPSVDVSSITSLAEQTSLLQPQDPAGPPGMETVQEEQSGLLASDQTPPPGRAVIHADSD